MVEGTGPVGSGPLPPFGLRLSSGTLVRDAVRLLRARIEYPNDVRVRAQAYTAVGIYINQDERNASKLLGDIFVLAKGLYPPEQEPYNYGRFIGIIERLCGLENGELESTSFSHPLVGDFQRQLALTDEVRRGYRGCASEIIY